ncbi:MAG: hypothetical protein HAW60_05820 [Bdellovibrionales bacterium]|nr:hypothetical protein [Bdellovibrionales bacterium]
MKDSQLDLKKIFYLESYEDFLQYLVKNLSGRKKTQAYFLYTDFKLTTNLVYLKNKKIHTDLNLDKKFSFIKNIQTDNKNINGTKAVDNIFIDSSQRLWSENYCKLLRDLLKKPVLPLVVIPFLSQSSVLCLEDPDGADEYSKIKQDFYQYYDCFSGSLSQIQSQNKLAFFSFLWEQAFEKNMDPMSIESSVFVKKNEIFKKSTLKDKTYEPAYYDIKTADNDKVKFCHYKDVSKILLLREDLLQRKKMEALGGLASQLSNQLNNPLAGIRGLVQILQLSIQKTINKTIQKTDKPSKDDKLLDSLNEIESETWRCRSIIENLKNFSNKNNIIQIFDLNKLVTDVIALSKVALSKSLHSVNLDKNILNIQGSRQLIQQVIFNLIINAVQAINDGDKIIIKSYKNNKKVILEIKDYGKGMSKHVQSQIFTPFFTTKKNKGTGLGLSMSLNIMKKFSGEIKVESVHGEYSLFTLIFPEQK